jgi:2-polyprenyl-6-methoxyphenol hydroxylase-like FAD-dependent oxidoreductase
MKPNLGQGAAQALEDAVVLAEIADDDEHDARARPPPGESAPPCSRRRERRVFPRLLERHEHRVHPDGERRG